MAIDAPRKMNASSDNLVSPIRMTFGPPSPTLSSHENDSIETLADTYTVNPRGDDLSLRRYSSPSSSVRGTYARSSRPTSFMDFESEQPVHFGGLGDLGNVDRAIEREVFFGHGRTTRRRSTIRRRVYDSDAISIVTTRTTVSTIRAVRNPDVCPPVLRQRERGSKVSDSGVKGRNPEEDDRERKSRTWKGPSRLKERFGMLFSGRKENAGILDRDEKRKKTFSFRRKDRDIDITPQIPASSPRSPSFFARRGSLVRKGSISSRGIANVPVSVPPLSPSANQIKMRKQQLRRSRSFAGFRGSIIQVDEEDDADIDEITKEATKVNEEVRRNYSYAEESDDS
ncbi:hypothetical protein VNI00_010644 [Paramarasmius palmivorus]|uniref:Uncharacterized protein n=1 Tax=Paramarasmius palmivorus TaxID=297713 RepID=A0AAW0CG44_9AGAR